MVLNKAKEAVDKEVPRKMRGFYEKKYMPF